MDFDLLGLSSESGLSNRQMGSLAHLLASTKS
jgi:hypothetical protein